MPRRRLDPGDAERQGARAWRERALGRPGRGWGSRGVRREGGHSPGLLFDQSVQHLGVEGVGGRFRVFPLLRGVCGEPGGTEVCAMWGWRSLSPLPRIEPSSPHHPVPAGYDQSRGRLLQEAHGLCLLSGPPAVSAVIPYFCLSSLPHPQTVASGRAGATPDLSVCPRHTRQWAWHTEHSESLVE